MGVRSAAHAWTLDRQDPKDPLYQKLNGPGIYTLYKLGSRFYVGQSQDLKTRLRQHLWCLRTAADVKLGDYSVKLTSMKGVTETKRKQVEEKAINKWGRRIHGGVLTNIRELEEELWGSAWK
jgi:hypothetical protein